MDINSIVEHLPFMVAAGGKVQFNVPRLIETALIAIVTAVIVNYTTAQVITAQMGDMKEQMTELKHNMDQMRRDLYAPRIRP